MIFILYQIWAVIATFSVASEKIEGLDGGADDYLAKPFHIQELLAHVRALTRRPSEIKAEDKLCYADLCFNKSNRELTCSQNTIFLTAKESELLYILMKSPETLFQREQLILKIWGTSSEVERGNVDN